MRLMPLLFGDVAFPEGREYRKFQYRFACAILLTGLGISLLFLLSVEMGFADFDLRFVHAERAFCAISLLFYLLLRGHPQRMLVVAYVYEALAFGLYVIVFFYNGVDEMRIIWFALNLPGVYLILGARAGAVVAIGSVTFVVTGNAHLEQPYSANAITTCVLAIVYISGFFHAFSARSISFHHGMVEANRKLADMAAKDPLTGLYNARAYYGLCDSALHQAQRSGGSFAMLFVDLDHFKRINDQYGHEAGDVVLKAVAQCLRRAVRQSDIVGRIGGEEFSVLLPDTDRDGAMQLAEKLRSDIEALMPDIGTERLRITASIGVAGRQGAAQSIADVQRLADQAMYEAKRQGRNRVTCIEEVAA